MPVRVLYRSRGRVLKSEADGNGGIIERVFCYLLLVAAYDVY